jgi:ribonuclease BN (tRNA processing enzyme)
MIDCGATSLVAAKRAGINPSEIEWILLSHLHGDHFGGIPFLALDGQFSRRERPLVVAGPAGVQDRVESAMEALYPGSSRTRRRFDINFVEHRDRESMVVGPVSVRPFEVVHASGAPPYALRIEYAGKVIVYSGDTEWTDALVEAARGADLLICEAYFFDKKVKFHLDYQTLLANRARLETRRIVLTHMSKDMLDREGLEMERASDGMTIGL